MTIFQIYGIMITPREKGPAAPWRKPLMKRFAQLGILTAAMLTGLAYGAHAQGQPPIMCPSGEVIHMTFDYQRNSTTGNPLLNLPPMVVGLNCGRAPATYTIHGLPAVFGSLKDVEAAFRFIDSVADKKIAATTGKKN